MLLLLKLSFVLALAPALLSCYRLAQNYSAARKTGLSVVISPFNPFNPLWILTRPYINPLLSYLPFGLSEITQYNYLGFTWRDQNRLHARYGKAYIIATPDENHLVVGDVVGCDKILKHYRNWSKNNRFNDPLNTFGCNLGTVDGEEWQKHRKVTAVAFNERNNTLVWQESVKQAKQMLSTWLSADIVETTVDDLNLLALHVLASAGFGTSYDFDSPLTMPASEHTMSYRDALTGIMKNIFITYFAANAGLLTPVLPKTLRATAEAVDEFRSYLLEMIKHEQAAYREGDRAEAANLMSSLVRASQAETQSDKANSRHSLTASELAGNLYIYNVAGFDTTAGTLAYAIGLLAVNPTWQTWLREEINTVAAEDEIKGDQYQDIWPRLKRCLAIMHETLRVYAPLNAIPKHTNSTYQDLHLSTEATHTIPPNTAVWVNNAAVQMDEAHWGSDVLEWRPDRWLDKSTGDIIQPANKEFLAWSAGPRVCPGKKFSQVEFVATLACLFHKHRVAAEVRKGETGTEARKRLLEVLRDSDMRLAMRINRPEKVRLKWEKVM
ncbi:Secologanin synthase [Cyphellophora attinorum]|uniref:Secologanin synthase n=1 Tax=Cyphellophora attinorum TaxID=1664694 RepID=A0A0N0NRD2_9EURO|nr:Secologanin synthase [Phialophora attinorum]KPI44958.1 Secologanin synthase [Phialophora attinorum]